MACCSRPGEIVSGMSAPIAGPPKARAVPCNAASTISSHTRAPPARNSSPVAVWLTVATVPLTAITRSRETRSAQTPPTRTNATNGAAPAASTNPRSLTEPVRLSTPNASAIGAIAPPSRVTVVAANRSRNSRSCSAPSSRRAIRRAYSQDAVCARPGSGRRRVWGGLGRGRPIDQPRHCHWQARRNWYCRRDGASKAGQLTNPDIANWPDGRNLSHRPGLTPAAPPPAAHSDRGLPHPPARRRGQPPGVVPAQSHETAALALAHGASTTMRDRSWDATPQHWAEHFERPELARLLAPNGPTPS